MIPLRARFGRVLCAALLLHTAPTLAVPLENKIVTNVTTLDYRVESHPTNPTFSVKSVAYLLSVSQVVRPVLICQNKPMVKVSSPSSNDVLTFVLSNRGNSPGKFALARNNGCMVLHHHRQYVPRNSLLYDSRNSPTGAMFLETNNVPGFQPNGDTPYVAGTNDPIIAAGGSQTIYVLSDTPLVDVGSQGEVSLTATSIDNSPPTPPPADGNRDDWWDAPPPATVTATGTFSTVGIGLLTTRTVVNRNEPIDGRTLANGSTVTYRIAVKLQGKGNAKSLVITEPLPPNMSYVPDSIRINGLPQTDTPDSNRAYFIPATRNNTNEIAISLGNLDAPISWVISFRAKLK